MSMPDARMDRLDSAPEEGFDRLTRLAVSALEVPAAFLSLVDEGRDFFKSVVGLPLAGGPELSALLRRTVALGAPLVIADARQVGIGAYAGVPVWIESAAIGAFCAVDFRPREWSEHDVELLVTVARSMEREIELQRALRGGTARCESVAPRERVVVAEDDASMRRLIVRTLSPDGYDLVEARDGRETLEILRRDRSRLLILDLVMPDVSGWHVLEQRLQDDHLRDVPVIVVSAKRGPDVARALAYGIFGLLPKPFNPADLRDLVRSCLTETPAGVPPVAS